MKSLTKGVITTVAVIFCAVLALKGSALLISSGTWQGTGNLSSARVGASAALLQDGRILITGGSSGSGTGALSLADKSSALVSIKRSCASAAVAA